jgi:hypothetical protein
MNRFSELEDKELYDKIEQGNLADGFLKSKNGKLVNEAARRIIEKAVCEFALRTDVNDIAKVIELQIIIRKYKFGLFEEIKMLAEDGREAEDELQDRKDELSDSITDSEQGS